MNRLFWDIETSLGLYWAWRCGRKVSLSYENIFVEPAIICICYKWEKCDTVYSMTWDCEEPLKWDDSNMIRKFREVAKGADEIIAHNGNNFDLKWINTRCLMAGVGPMPIITPVDTLRMTRSKFRFQSNRLDYLSKRMGGDGKLHTDFGLWVKTCLGDKKALREMVEYCKNDVVVVQDYHKWIQSFCNAESHAGAAMGRGRWTCPHDGSENVTKNGSRHTSMGIKKWKMQCKDCNKNYQISDKVHRDYLEAKHENDT